MNDSSICRADLRASFCALAFAALAAGCSVDASGKIPCHDTSNCPGVYPACSAAGFCVAGAAPTKLQISAGDAQTGVAGSALANLLVVQLLDANGNAVPTFAITWTVASGAGSFVSANGTTGPDGKASVTAILGNLAGTNHFTATAAGLTGSSVTFTETGAPGVATTFAVTFPTSVVANSANSATVNAFDAFNNPTSYSGSVKVTVGKPDSTAVLPQAAPLSFGVGASGTVGGIALGKSLVGQSVIISDEATPAITGKQTGITVSSALSSTTLSSTANPSVFGQPVTFIATVTSPATGTPSGTVTFTEGTTALGAPVALSSGVAVLTLSSLLAGNHSITVAYAGDTSFAASANSILQVVTREASTVTLAQGSSPSVFGQSVTFTATISVTSPGSGSPTGTVTFNDNGTPISGCPGPVGSNLATCSTSMLSLGTHSITAIYNGDTNFSFSPASPPVTQQVTQAATTVALATSGSPTVFGQSVTFTATISVTAPGSGSTSGTVTFNDNGTPISGCPGTVGSNQATCSTSSLSIGTHSITAIYSGDTNFAASPASPAVTQQVNKAATTVTLTTSQPGGAGNLVTLDAIVTGNTNAFPSGTVAFKRGAATTVPPSCTLVMLTTSSGECTVQIPLGATGPATFTATYGGDLNYLTSTASQTFTVTGPQPIGTAAATITGGAAAGSIFIAGGSGRADGIGPARGSWIYHPATSSLTAGPTLAVARAFHTATAIGAGQVLLAGGNSRSGSTFEICSLGGATPWCAPTGGSLATPRCNAAAVLVSTSPARVLLAGGDDCSGGGALASWILWDGTSPTTAAHPIPSTFANQLSEPRTLLTATVVAAGTVLLAGGGTASADLFTLGPSVADSSVAPVGPMSAVRSGHTATLLTTGTTACPAGACVLLAGGVSEALARTWEIFDLARGSFGRPAGVAELVSPLRSRHAAALLADKRVLLAGGTAGNAQGVATTEYFDPDRVGFTAGLALRTSRAGAASAYVPALDLLMLTGGSGAGSQTPELITGP